ncbi:MAG: haloacid dehalogenase [Gemmatimonadetes bacterium 13_2_20CM_2_65_7]|nr:MAG: haloacid dehalogenase [Gemmatimonadetes bacterium 13_2_20CM_2_65_7]
MKKHYILASDFDQTLSFNDSGIVLSEMLGITSFREKVAGLSALNLVQQGAELAYLLANDPEYRRVTRADLLEVGRRVRLKRNVRLLTRMLAQGIDGHRFDFYVISAAPEEVVLSALDGIVPADHVVGTRFRFKPEAEGGQIDSLVRVAAGYGKVAAVEEIRTRHVVPRDQVVYVGDGQSDIPVMLHVNRGDGFTIAASEAREVAHIAKRTVISDDALSVLVPVLEEIAGFGPSQIRALFEDHGLVIQEWDRVRTDWLTIRDGAGDGVIRLDLATGT